MWLSIVLLSAVATSATGQGLRDWLPDPLQYVLSQKDNLTRSEGLSPDSQWSLLPVPDRMMNLLSDPLATAANTVDWLFSSEKFTQYDTSDLHDVELSNNLTQEEADRYSENSSSDSSWTTRISELAKYGRQFFSATNALTLGYESGELVANSYTCAPTQLESFLFSVIQTVTCLATSEYTDPDLGTFALNASKYCDPKCGESNTAFARRQNRVA